MQMSCDLKSAIRSILRHSRAAAVAVALPAMYAGLFVQNAHAQDADASAVTQDERTGLEEITVTATRQAIQISKVPISISAFSQDQMDQQGFKRLDDLTRFTPGLNVSGTNQSQISIRGIASTAGARTVGVYIDDTPIQLRAVPGASGSAVPALFDLERVEVLRGPQGTLFGAGSEGGTIRFIQEQPSLNKFSSYTRAEINEIESGSYGFEAGAALGGPIIENKLGFRISALYRRDGGYIDAVQGTYTVLDPRGRAEATGGKSIAWQTSNVLRPDTNWGTTTGARATLKWEPTDSVTVTPSIFYQKVHLHDGSNAFGIDASDPSRDVFVRYTYPAGPVVPGAHTALDISPRDLGNDSFYLPAVLVQWSLGQFEFISNTSYFDRNYYAAGDFTNLYEQLYSKNRPPPAGDSTRTDRYNVQHIFTEEARVQSSNPDSRLNWVAGLFYSRSSQFGLQRIGANWLQDQSPLSIVGDPNVGVAGGPPFGPGSSAFVNYFGYPELPGSVTWTSSIAVQETQLAAFLQTDFKITEQLKLTAGVRVSKNKLELNAAYGGAENNLNYASGRACDTGAVCPQGVGTFAPAFPVTIASADETATTPKVGLTYQINEDNMIYTTAAKGYRPAGAQLLAPESQCSFDLDPIGYLDANGHSTQKQIYGSDSVWSYELGSKNRLFGGRATIDGSIYQIRWSNIQTSINLPICAYSFVDNVGHATANGVDLALRGQIVGGLVLGGTFAYNRTLFTDNVLTPSGSQLYGKDTGVPNAPAPIVFSVMGDYNFKVRGQGDFYAHADFTHSTEQRRAGQTSPVSSSYQPLYHPVEAYSTLNVRLGTRAFDGADISFFINNATNAHPDLAINRSSYIWTNTTLQPRTFGVTFTYRQ